MRVRLTSQELQNLIDQRNIQESSPWFDKGFKEPWKTLLLIRLKTKSSWATDMLATQHKQSPSLPAVSRAPG